MSDRPAPPPWPYPRWIAHRGAGRLAPENTLAAFRTGAAHGYRMYECDVKLSADGVPYLLHDANLDRTTNGHGPVAEWSWAALSLLDAGRWHSSAHAGEPLATLAAVAAHCQAHGHHVNLELKPVPGTSRQTGEGVAQAVLALWVAACSAPPAPNPPNPALAGVWPLLSSFDVDCLRAAQRVAPHLPTALLLDRRPPDWLDTAQALGCRAVVAHHPLWTAEAVRSAQEAGLRTAAYTVNDADIAQRLLDWGLDSLITDAVDRFHPNTA